MIAVRAKKERLALFEQEPRLRHVIDDSHRESHETVMLLQRSMRPALDAFEF